MSAREPEVVPTSAMSPSRVLYIGGYGRSGSTLLDRILGQIPGICSVGEVVHIWQRGVKDNERCGCGDRFHDCLFWRAVGVAAFGGWSRLDVERILWLKSKVDRNRFVPLLLDPGRMPTFERRWREYSSIIEALYHAIQEVSGASLVVDSSKHASYAYLLRTLPGVKIQLIHLVRHSAGVAHSWSKTVVRPEVVDKTAFMPTRNGPGIALRWVWHNSLFDYYRRIEPRSLLVTYEEFVSDPRGTLRDVLGRLESDVPEHHLSYLQSGAVTLKANHTVSGNPSRFLEGPVELRLDTGWQKMGTVRRGMIQLLSYPMLVRYGYIGRRGNHGSSAR